MHGALVIKFQSDGPSWSVPTGRRDGKVSLSSQVSNLPSPLDSIAVQKQKFADKGLDDQDLVTLVGINHFSHAIYIHSMTGKFIKIIITIILRFDVPSCPSGNTSSHQLSH